MAVHELPYDGDELAAPQPSGPPSLMDRLRAQQREQAADRTLELAIPDYHNPEFIARYRFLPASETKAIAARVERQFKGETERYQQVTMRQLVAACIGVFARDEDSDVLVPVTLEDGDEPCCYDERLAAFFGIEAASATETLRQVFHGNEYAINVHGGQFQEWLAGTTGELSERSLGES